MLYPSIQELLKSTEKDGKERLNKYSITMVTAKCARVITNEYAEQCYLANKKGKNDDGITVKKEYKDEKSVKNALRELKDGEFEVYLPEEEGYESAMVDIKNYVEPKEEPVYVKAASKVEAVNDEDEDYDDFDDEEEETSVEELMGATTVFDDDSGYTVEDAE